LITLKKLVLTGLCVIATSNVTAGGWTTYGKINKIAIEHRNGENNIYINIVSPLQSTCPRTDYLALSADTEEKLNRLYSTVLADKLSNAEMSFYTSDDCDSSGMPKVHLLSL